MRSELIFGALTHMSNRYQLCQLASKATRKLHKPNTRLQDTMNDVLVRFREQSPAAAAAVPRHEPISLPATTAPRCLSRNLGPPAARFRTPFRSDLQLQPRSPPLHRISLPCKIPPENITAGDS